MPPPGTSGTRLVSSSRRTTSTPGRARAADELVRAEEHRVLVGSGSPSAGRPSRCRRTAPRRRSPRTTARRARAAAPEMPCGVGDDAGDVAGGGERPDLAAAGRRTRSSSASSAVDVDVPVGVLGDRHDVGDRLAPRQLVGVVLERPDEHHRALVGGMCSVRCVPVVEAGGDAQAQDADQLVDGAGASPEPAKITHASSSSPPTASWMIAAGVLAQPGGLQAGAAGLGVGVGVARQHLVADEVLDERQRPAARGVVGVGDPPRAVRAGHHLVVADHRLADPRQQRRLRQSARAFRDQHRSMMAPQDRVRRRPAPCRSVPRRGPAAAPPSPWRCWPAATP